jgi:hypothetical protein
MRRPAALPEMGTYLPLEKLQTRSPVRQFQAVMWLPKLAA